MERSVHSAGRTSLPPPPPEPAPAPAPGRGVCMVSTLWRDKQNPNLVNFIAAFLAANSYRLNFLSISPYFIFNNGGLSVAFIFDKLGLVNTVKWKFKNLYGVVAVPTVEQIEPFNRSYFQYDMELRCPTFVPVNDLEMEFEKMLKIAHARGVCKQQDISSTMRNEREQAVQSMDAFYMCSPPFLVLTTTMPVCLPKLLALLKQSQKHQWALFLSILTSTDKADTVVTFFRDPQHYLLLKP